jgi:hypothetical protein
MIRWLRKRDNINIQKKIYIFSEWECTEVLYFEWLIKKLENEIRRKEIAILIEWTWRSNTSLVKYAIQEMKKVDWFDLENDEIWVVFDEDTVWGWKFDNSIKKAEAKNIKVAYSNECFELWILLHYEYVSSAIWRKQYYEKLWEILKLNYVKEGKSVKDIYDKIESGQKNAIKYAKKLLKLKEYEWLSPSKCKPSTTVHLLVEKLNSLKQ